MIVIFITYNIIQCTKEFIIIPPPGGWGWGESRARDVSRSLMAPYSRKWDLGGEIRENN